MTYSEDEGYCWDMKEIAKRYEELVKPALAKVFRHLVDCPRCKQHFLKTRDAPAMLMLSLPDERLLESIEEMVRELEE